MLIKADAEEMTATMQAERLAVIGGGAAATILLSNLQSQHTNVGSITQYAGANVVGPGRAYKWDLSNARMNLPNYAVSVDGSSSSDYLNWLNDNTLSAGTEPTGPFDFSSRRVFGRYLRYTHLRAIRSLSDEHGVDVNIRHTAAETIRVEASNAAISVTDSIGRSSAFDRIILCLGTAPPSDPYRLEGTDLERYIRDPYPFVEHLSAVPTDAHVGILGTGLAAVDVIRALTIRGHRGHITAFSRHGRLPRVRNPEIVTRPVIATPQRVHDLIRRGHMRTLTDAYTMVANELRQRDIAVEPILRWYAITEPAESLRYQLDLLNHNERSLELAMNIVHPNVEQIWNALGQNDKCEFAHRYRSDFSAFMSPMPPDVAHQILTLFTSGRLTIQSGITGAHLRGDERGFIVTSTAGETSVDHLVNTTTPTTGSTFADRRASSIVAELQAEGTIRFDDLGGIAADFHTGAITGDNRIFALGHATSGTHILTNSIVALNRQAATIVNSFRR